eukprot:TRINITY_DN16253_c0_g1_i1.p2 TRINITY_DN16253_c0_g1~~TRINITY_DN16253_c0_g1_i1.p2  ORF type:complete len:144 (-),score=22.80 TRINITY_DN16253_c0_g1_i1:109-540(-)
MTRELGALITAAAAVAGTALGFVLSRTALKPQLGTSTVKHVVICKFKADLTAEKIAELIDGYKGLTEKISAMKGWEWGTDVSVENAHKGFTHVFITTFDDEAGRDAYLKDEAHEEFAKVFLGHLDDALILDYVPKVALSKFYV